MHFRSYSSNLIEQPLDPLLQLSRQRGGGVSGGAFVGQRDRFADPEGVTALARTWEGTATRTVRTKVGKGADAGAVEIGHPKTTMWGIRAVLIQEIDDSNDEHGQ